MMFKINASRIRGLIFEHGMSISELAQTAKLNLITARKVVVDGASVTAKTVSALAKFFGVNGNELILKRSDSNNDD